ncbi:S-adenosyl-L-methionine-dependent methyltransferase [Polyplosphaeria fusca]|uniref:S-adenosyl-L-methionine-dependent methyltransferase n=1 Tax=Polyplosphaeria fusca TaxID=682080 RepID=A0A9P4R169_9PLEO|nr:S-adenosyl-L-methionine-dependent methyltransferase [Polyplosphaeria fusca]
MCVTPTTESKMSIAEANRKYFDAVGDAYDNKPWWAKVDQQVTETIRSNLAWLGIALANAESGSDVREVRFLDYACGPGSMSRIFKPYVSVTRGMDISPNMVASYNARARAANLPPSAINAIVGDIFSKDAPPAPEISTPEYHNFDLAAVGFGFHHFEDVVHAARCLKERLRPGGVLLITDFLQGGDLKAAEDGSMIEGSEGDWAPGHQHHGHGHGHGHGHHKHEEEKTETSDDPATVHREKMNASIMIPSFTIENVKRFFEGAGFVDVDVILMPERAYMAFGGNKIWRTVLLAKGRRPFEKEEKSEL